MGLFVTPPSHLLLLHHRIRPGFDSAPDRYLLEHRHDRDHRSHSIYTDVLYLAEELKNTFGHNIEDHMQSPKTFEKRVERWKQGLRLDVRELPL